MNLSKNRCSIPRNCYLKGTRYSYSSLLLSRLRKLLGCSFWRKFPGKLHIVRLRHLGTANGRIPSESKFVFDLLKQHPNHYFFACLWVLVCNTIIKATLGVKITRVFSILLFVGDLIISGHDQNVKMYSLPVDCFSLFLSSHNWRPWVLEK